NTNVEHTYNGDTSENIASPGFQPQAPPSVPSAPAPRPYGSMKQKVSPYLKYKGGAGNSEPLIRAGYFRMKNDASALID
uniref:Uncharacterized protein n=1 Tax=Romanomermis culicivorax TaxID=13658 RepID=A0A915JKA6_ROMCU